jgi:hypothetical protein
MKSKSNFFLLIIIFCSILLIFLYFSKNNTYLQYLLHSSKNFFTIDHKDKLLTDSIYYVVKVDSLKERLKQLEIEEIYWQNRIQMARDKSVDLAIDLVEHIIILEMNGVILKKNNIFTYQTSPSLSQVYNSDSLIFFLTTPFQLKNSWATIPKEPIIVKEIPKNPEEAYLNTPTEIPIDSSYVHLILQFNKNFSIEIIPQQKTKDREWLIINKYDGWLNTSPAKKEIPMIEKCILPLQKYWIKLYINNNDARVIYRALSDDSELSLRF